MKKFALIVACLLLLPVASFAKTYEQCVAELEVCADTCCQEHGGSMVDEGGTTHCSVLEDRDEWQSTCLQPCLTPYNYCMMGTTSGGASSGWGCCGAFILLGFGGVGALAFARKS